MNEVEILVSGETRNIQFSVKLLYLILYLIMLLCPVFLELDSFTNLNEVDLFWVRVCLAVYFIVVSHYAKSDENNSMIVPVDGSE